MAWRLRDGLHHRDLGGVTVFVDVRAGRYFALQGSMHESFQAFATDPARDAPARGYDLLRERGVLVRVRAHTPAADGRPGGVAQATADLAALDAPRPGVPSVAAAAASYLGAAIMVRRRAFGQIVDALSVRRAQMLAPRDTDTYGAYRGAAAALDALRPITGATDNCLVRAVAFLALCSRRGLRPALVLGVQVRPFSAHCWVQEGEVVLNDRLEHVRGFAPLVGL